MKAYEIMYILKTNLEDEARVQLIGQLHGILSSNGATIKNVDEWGMRGLAYPIKDEVKGYYVVIKIDGDSRAIDEFNRLVRLNPNVLRFLITIDKAS
jgi:small subunit ribosomal protein S6